MEYALAPLFRSGEPTILNVDEYRRIARAKDALVTTIGIEQKFDLLIENYVEYENELLTLALRKVAFKDSDWAGFHGEKLTVTRRLANLLSTARLYLDQVPQDLCEIVGEAHPAFDLCNRIRREQYDLTLGYRLMETLRNTIQHNSISGIQLRSRYETEKALDADVDPTRVDRRVVVRVGAFLDVSDLQNSTLKASVRDEILSAGEDVDLTPRVREYIDGLSVVHAELRRVIGPERAEWVSIIREVHKAGIERWPVEGSGALDLTSTDAAGKILESRHIFLEPVEYLAALERKNALRLRFSRTYVSNASDRSKTSAVDSPPS